jgi:hypothetical protein
MYQGSFNIADAFDLDKPNNLVDEKIPSSLTNNLKLQTGPSSLKNNQSKTGLRASTELNPQSQAPQPSVLNRPKYTVGNSIKTVQQLMQSPAQDYGMINKGPSPMRPNGFS